MPLFTAPLFTSVGPDLEIAANVLQHSSLFKALTAGAAGADSATAQPWFPSAGAVTVAASRSYFMEGFLRTTRAAGAVSHTTGVLFAGTATLTSISYVAHCNTGDVATNIARNGASAIAATELVVKAASTSTTENTSIFITGIIRINGAGTLIPQFKYSAAPGGAPTVLTDTFFLLQNIGTNTVTTKGTWA